MKYLIVFDGGSRGNPGQAYGSYRIQRDQEVLQNPVRLQFGVRTNNEAEYLTLLAAIEASLDQIRSLELSPSDVSMEIRGDSTLVLNQIEGSWKAKDPRMRELRDQCRSLLGEFKGTTYHHQPRHETVAILGH